MVRLTINGKTHNVDVDPNTPLLWVIREQVGLTGTKYGCGVAQCGACTVHIDGAAVRSCGTPVSAAVGKRITAPTGELGATTGEDYYSGHIRTEYGTHYNVHAYMDPFVAGFETANLGSIIPVNAVPGTNRLEAIDVVEDEWQQATEADESAESHGIEKTQPIGRPAANQHRSTVPPMPRRQFPLLRMTRNKTAEEQKRGCSDASH